MKMSKLSNQTNSLDPQAVNSRVFVGNLNTFQCSKTDVERMFQKYGRLAGISMHKGYAFVQFTNPFDARNACHGEDGRTILSQVLDVNMVAEPKAHQIGRKRQNVSKTGNDWDYYYDSYYASTLFPSQALRPMKRQRLMTPQQARANAVNAKVHQATALAQQTQQQQQQLLLAQNSILANSSNEMNRCHMMNSSLDHSTNGQFLGPFKIYSNPDTLICGNCRECFSELGELLDHKRTYCKLRFTCKCQDVVTAATLNNNASAINNNNTCKSGAAASPNGPATPNNGTSHGKTKLEASTKLLCAVCKDAFSSPWDLMVHVQAAHTINIYELGDRVVNGGSKVATASGRVDAKSTVADEDGDLSGDALSPKSSESKEDASGVHLAFNVLTTVVKEDEGGHSPIAHENDSLSSSRNSSPHPDLDTLAAVTDDAEMTSQSCIMRALSIEAKAPTSLGIVGTSIAITMANGAVGMAHPL